MTLNGAVCIVDLGHVPYQLHPTFQLLIFPKDNRLTKKQALK